MFSGFDSVLTALGLSKGATIGGFLGALVSLKFIEGLNVWQRAGTVLGGMLSAAYVTPLVIIVVELSPKAESAVAFLIGVFGMSVAAAVVKAMPELITAAKERISGGKGGDS